MQTICHFYLRQDWLAVDHVSLILMAKHEIIPCERCGAPIECKANSYTKCQCSVVQLNLNEVQYISEHYEGCLCAKCLFELQLEYRETVDS